MKAIRAKDEGMSGNGWRPWLAAIGLLCTLLATACGVAAPAPPPEPTKDIPLLSEQTVYSLVLTYITNAAAQQPRLAELCLPPGGVTPGPVPSEASIRYRGQGTWVAQLRNPGCTFVVDDRTSEVSGP